MIKTMLPIEEEFEVSANDYKRAGEASASIKKILRQMELSAPMLRRVSVASYEAELNLVIHSLGGRLKLKIDEEKITLISEDIGPGIDSVEDAMRSGFSTATDEARGFGFGAGMGLPNMEKNASVFNIVSEKTVGTVVTMNFLLTDEDF